MGPRIILRGAIPIDSNIGGYGHRPLFWRGGVSWLVRLSCAFLVLCVAWSCGVMLARSGLCKDPVFRARNMHLLEPMVLPWLSAVLPLREGTVLPRQSTVLPLECGTSAERYYRDDARYYRAIEWVWGL